MSEETQPQEPLVQGTVLSKTEMIEQIIRANDKYRDAKKTVRSVHAAIEDELESMEAYQEMKAAEEELERKREALRLASMGNGHLNDLKEQLAEEKSNRKLAKDVLSGLLVRYAADYRVRSIDLEFSLNDATLEDVHEIRLTGAIGRKVKQQVELPL